ncbi:MAG: glutathione S-transferase N-terminal domain-containing protein [Myxococcales bacterium]
MQRPRLTTFLVSHFSEKARWGLDYEGVLYEERPLLPGPHLLVTRGLAKKTSVPILEHAGRVIQGSTPILDYLATELGKDSLEPDSASASRARELEALADQAFGLGVQRISYFYLLDGAREGIVELFTQNGPWWGRPFYALTFPIVAKETRKLYDVTAERTAESKALFRSAMTEFDTALRGRAYLGGQQPSRLDITVAALLAPFCRPPEHVMHWPELPEGLAEFASEFVGRPTWQHVLEMYRLHRARTTT